jgi:GNAT superfamily N-acetyltransferase
MFYFEVIYVKRFLAILLCFCLFLPTFYVQATEVNEYNFTPFKITVNGTGSATYKRLVISTKNFPFAVTEANQLVGVSGMQSDGMITMLYVLPQWQNRGCGSRLLKVMREYGKDVCGFPKVTVNANPAWTSFYFAKKGFVHVNANKNLRVPFIPMYASSAYTGGYEKRHVSKGWMLLAAFGCVAFATIVGSMFMISYLF